MAAGASRRRLLRSVVAAAIAVAFAAAAVVLISTRQRARSGAQAADIYEAVIRYRAAGEFPRSDVFFVSIRGHDPSPGLTRRFATGSITVKPMSEAQTPERRGPPLDILGIKWISGSEVEVESQSIFSQMHAIGMTHRLVHKGDQWIVVRAERRWVS